MNLKSLFFGLFVAAISFYSLQSRASVPVYSNDPFISLINISQFDTAGWNKISSDTYARYFIRDFDTVYMIPAQHKYIFKVYLATEQKGRLIYDNLATTFGNEERSDTQFNTTWRWYNYKIKFLWKDDEITVTTWI